MIGFPASKWVYYVTVPFLAFAAFIGYGYGLQFIQWLWPFPHHRPWLYIVPGIQGIVVAVAVSAPIVLFLVRNLRPWAVACGAICALPIACFLLPSMLNQHYYLATRLIAGTHAGAFFIALVGGSTILRSNTRWSGPHHG